MAQNSFGLTSSTMNFGLGHLSKKPKGKRKQIGKQLRNQVWAKYLGNRTQGKCFCCKIIPIHFQNFEVGHNKSVYRGGSNHINNLRPICRDCNRKMGIKSIDWYRKKFFANPVKRTKPVKRRASKIKPKNYNAFGLKPILKMPKSSKNIWKI